MGIVTNDPHSLELLANLKHEELDRIIGLARANGLLHRAPTLGQRLGSAWQFASGHLTRKPGFGTARERQRARERALRPH
ncbi:MAG: hypothetical protein ACRDG3_02760 [Tepidiformaceae bacterium]